jgi:hypothetical protein
MPDPKESHCTGCDQICITPYNPDQECFGNMTAEERLAYAQYLVDLKESNDRANTDTTPRT